MNNLGIVDENGLIVAKYSYKAFGEYTIKKNTNNIAIINPFRFKGYYYDNESGMYYCQTRYYVPEWGRWLNADSVDFLKFDNINGMNLFAYCGNNPVMNVDPSGAFWHIFAAAFIGAAAGAFGQFISDCISGEWSSWQSYIGAAVSGAVSSALVATGVGAVGASVFGSLVADATTLGLNIITGQETRTASQILIDVTENALLSAAFAFGSELISSSFARNSGLKSLTPLLQDTGKFTVGVFFRELAIGIKDSLQETVFDGLFYKIKQFLA